MIVADHHLNLLADIGGTNARFALFSVDKGIHKEEILPCKEFPSIESAVECYCRKTQASPLRASIAIATAVVGDFIQMTNHHWGFSVNALQHHFSWQKLVVLNDFEALAMSLPQLTAKELIPVGESMPAEPGVKAVIGPGTGLGVASLVQTSSGWQAIAGEGGHANYIVQTEREFHLLKVLQARFNGYVSCERIVSGPGLVNAYEGLAKVDGVTVAPLTPAEITERARQGDRRCMEVIEIFLRALASAAANLALTVGARGGVYIGGGIVPRLGDLFDAGVFRHTFENKGRFSNYLRTVPVWIVDANNPAFVGAAYALRHCK